MPWGLSDSGRIECFPSHFPHQRAGLWSPGCAQPSLTRGSRANPAVPWWSASWGKGQGGSELLLSHPQDRDPCPAQGPTVPLGLNERCWGASERRVWGQSRGSFQDPGSTSSLLLTLPKTSLITRVNPLG